MLLGCTRPASSESLPLPVPSHSFTPLLSNHYQPNLDWCHGSVSHYRARSVHLMRFELVEFVHHLHAVDQRDCALLWLIVRGKDYEIPSDFGLDGFVGQRGVDQEVE